MNKKKVVVGAGILLLLTSIFPLETQCILSCNVWVDKICGSTYRIGAPVVIYFSVNESAYIELLLIYPNGHTKQLTSSRVSGGIAYYINGTIGELTGKRTLMLRARNGSEYDEDTCIYYGGEASGLIHVESTPSEGKCYLNGSYRGRTPMTISDIPPGNHTVKITKSRYIPWIKTVTVYPNETTYISAVLQKEPGSIHITSIPSGAECYLDGIFQGTTPSTIPDVSPGRHIVTLKKDDYHDWRDSVYVSAGETSKVTATLKIQVGSLDVDSNVDGAHIFLNEGYKGEAPLEIENVPVGDQKIGVSADKFYDFTGTVVVKADETSYIDAILEEKPGSIYVDSTPAGADGYLNRSYIGNTPFTISAIKGTYTLTLKHFGYYDKTIKLDVYPDETTPAHITLQKAFWRTWYFFLIVVMGLMLPGFVMYLRQRQTLKAAPATASMTTPERAARIARAPFIPVEMLLHIQLEDEENRCPICNKILENTGVLECIYCRDEGFTCKFHEDCWENHKKNNEIRSRTRCYKHYGIYVPERDIRYPFRMLADERQSEQKYPLVSSQEI